MTITEAYDEFCKLVQNKLKELAQNMAPAEPTVEDAVDMILRESTRPVLVRQLRQWIVNVHANEIEAIVLKGLESGKYVQRHVGISLAPKPVLFPADKGGTPMLKGGS